ncbi:TolC family protein [Aneurinibacillus sp. Ricciae_BoGa-3]|uniref:TolC family protein n=1 Tax=Aneurinibacillus sp. Ricciae_BoGa-3 TaxID=3022697 RepID=UPI0023403C6D|nr:TolC family protein [Aneurinibacillus sp. Ricciae_BoGa-3]WCK54280.1 TolC family protein [Aneurinibacillus sp. Ricciae_BoGa-3]
MRKTSGILLTSMLLIPAAVPAYADSVPAQSTGVQSTQTQSTQKTPQGLTLQQAIDTALGYSYSLKEAATNIDRAADVRDQAADNVKYNGVVPVVQPGGNFTYSTSTVASNSVFSGAIQAGIGYQMAKRTYTAQQDGVVYSVRKAYNAILQAQAKLSVDQLAVKNAQVQNDVARAKYSVGTASNFDSVNAETSMNAATKTITVDETALSSAYQALNQLMGYKSGDRPQLAEQPKFEPLQESDLEGHVSRVLSDSPTVWNAQQNIDVKKLNLDLYVFNNHTSTTPYEAVQKDVTNAVNEYANVKDQMAGAVRSLYYNIRQLEDQYTAAEAQLPALEEAARIAKVQFDAGVGTQADMVAANLKVEQLQEKLYELNIAHDNAIAAYNKPWAAASGGSSSSSQSSGS